MGKHDFCRGLLSQIRPYVEQHVPIALRKTMWTYIHRLGYQSQGEFHLGEGSNVAFYNLNDACCHYHARYQGWAKYLESIGVEFDDDV
tara:strand:+ start:900 stop:1163 length:264 start_codon:yes stop_codon:yes gene_type:complete